MIIKKRKKKEGGGRRVQGKKKALNKGTSASRKLLPGEIAGPDN